MPPNKIKGSFISEADEQIDTNEDLKSKEPIKRQPPIEIVWRNVAIFAVLHGMAVYGLYLKFSAKLLTWIWIYVGGNFQGLGITAGAHRLWAHRSYGARLPLRIFLVLMNSMACQNDVIEWSRDHRVHHKFSETDADPHNAKRGFSFAHMGWLLVRKHPDVKEKGKGVDMSDLLNDPVLIWQRKLYIPSVLLMCFIMPTLVPWYFWGESLWISYFTCIYRYVLSLHLTWLVNSAAHMWGMKPYDKNINPAENFLVSFCAVGEGFHNYHHTFPQDYATSEYGWVFNPTTMFLDIMYFLGQVTWRKHMSEEVIAKRMHRTGDGSTTFGKFLSPVR